MFSNIITRVLLPMQILMALMAHDLITLEDVKIDQTEFKSNMSEIKNRNPK